MSKTELCSSCKTDISFGNAIPCEWCNRNVAKNCIFTLEPVKDESEQPLFCKSCTNKCDHCEIRGCKECVVFVCCDCDYDMCKECRNNDDILCGCFGNCYTCSTDVNRGSEGWPCDECEKWYCDDCRQGENPCKECGPNSSEDDRE